MSFDIEYLDSQFSANSKEITFRGKLEVAVHNWFRMTASYSPMLVDRILRDWETSGVTIKGKSLLEPFAGVGTTPVVAALNEMKGSAVELNPALHFVTKNKIYWIRHSNRIAELNEAYNWVGKTLETISRRNFKSLAQFTKETGIVVPALKNIERWFDDKAITDFLLFRQELNNNSELTEDVRDFIKTAMAAMLLEISHVEHNRVSLTIGKTRKPYEGLAKPLLKKVGTMIDDLESLQGIRVGKFNSYNGDARTLSVLPEAEKFDFVVTSPPYPNRFSYTRETRPHMFMLDLVADASEVGNLEMNAIGGTWGKATWILKKPVPNLSPEVSKACRKYISKINDEMMQNYVLLFFQNMFLHAQSLGPKMERNGKLAYVIGNSKIKEVLIPADEILAEIFNSTGHFAATQIHRMRKRHSQTGLYEATVFFDSKSSH